MNDSLIQKAIARSNLNRVFISLLGIFIVLGFAAFNYRYLYNFIFGPFDADTADLVALNTAGETQKYWVNVSGDELINTGIQYYTTKDNGTETVNTTYFAMVLADRLLLVGINGDNQQDYLPGTQTGWLAPVSSEESTQVISALEQNEPEITGMFLPYKMQTGNFRLNGYIGIVAGLLVIALSLWGLVGGLRRMSDPNAHPIMKKLERFGPLDFVTSRIDAELASAHQQIGKMHLTANWLVFADSASFLAARYEDIIWIYKHVLTQRTYGIVTARTYTAIVADRFGERLNFTAGRKEQPANEMLDAVYAHAPWAVTGYSNDLEKTWNKNRAAMIAEVDSRKAQMSAGA